jgi:curli biogenesis system outer membrane secretion channel CsgG
MLLLMSLAGCVAVEREVAPASQPLPSVVSHQVPIPKNKKLIAIVGFENKSTYASDKLWETSSRLLYSSLLQAGYFRVVEWERMKQLFDYADLSTSRMLKSPERRVEARKILLCEYFISGAVTFFDVRQRSSVSAMSKKKTIETTVRVDLMLQDSATGEYVAASQGEATERQEFDGGLSGGQQGTWDPLSADRALDRAIRSAVDSIIVTAYRNQEAT